MATQLRPERRLGKTGVSVPLVGYGTAPLGKEHITREHAVRCLNHAIDLGITYLDTSPDYGSEPHVGEVMRARRDEVFLATKVNRRSREGVLDEIRESLDRLQTDHLDLIQIHSVAAFADLEMALAPDGAVAGLEKAREQGLVRFIGITGHARPEILAYALEQYPFDTVLVALGMADRLITRPEIFLLPTAQEQQTGIIAMKTLGHGCFPDPSLALRYSLGLPGVSLAIVGMANEREIEEIATIAAHYQPLTSEEEQRLVEQVRPVLERDMEDSETGKGALFWLRDTSVTGWKHQDEPQLVSY